MHSYSGKRFCVLGDSISTYEGYTPASVVFYDSYFQRLTGVTSVNDTWWMQVITDWAVSWVPTTPTPAAQYTVPGQRPGAPITDPSPEPETASRM